MASSFTNKVTGLYIEKCLFITAEGNLDFTDVVVELNYFEDIFTNAISGTLLVSDSSGWQNKLSLCGDEFLELIIHKFPPDDKVTQPERGPLKGVFRIYSMSNRHLANQSNENILIHFCSEELFLSERIKVSKSYKGKRISDIVIDIAENYLKIPPEELGFNEKTQSYRHVEETLGLYDIVIPNMMPLQAINWLCTLAISNSSHGGTDSGATFLFWKNRNGYFFMSYLAIFNNVKVCEYHCPHLRSTEQGNLGYWYGAKNVDYPEGFQYDPYEQIISMHILDSYDALEANEKAIFSNKVLTIDYLRRVHEEHNFDYEKYFDGYLKSRVDMYKNYNTEKIMSNAVDRFRKKHNEYPEGDIRIYPSTTYQKDNPYIQSHQPDIKPNFAENVIPYRKAQLNLLRYNRVKMLIPGDPYIAIGDIIKIHMPQTYIDNKGRKIDRFFSGYYLVTCLRHVLDQENNFQTLLEVVKDAYTKDEVDEDKQPGLTPFGNTLQQYNARMNRVDI